MSFHSKIKKPVQPFSFVITPTNPQRQSFLDNAQSVSGNVPVQAQLEQVARLGHHLGRVAIGSSRAIQPKLTIGQPGDRYEQEADRVAEQVVNMPKPVQRQEQSEEEMMQTKPLVQRQEMPEEEEMQMKPELQREEMPEEEEELQMKSSVQATTAMDTSSLENELTSSKGGGSPLSGEVRGFMEPRFGADFSGVKVHTDGSSVQMNQSIQAQAFTHGKDIYFNSGKYSPETSEGKQLLAHELTHVVQQTGER